ncbi:MAG: IgGFc-binding protein, partial [Deltaproteobacteria bacterium]|nr:IgGFc-binding protein [Deltaproteobacteria bacterium]
MRKQTSIVWIPDQSVDASIKAKRAYRIVADLPIVAYQFNPLDNVNVFSNDASLLIPRTVFDVDYYVMSKPTLDRRTPSPGTNPYYGYLTVVAWQDNTQIAVTPTAAITAGPSNGPIAAGATATFTLNAFDVLQLQAAGAGDLTGTHIVSTNATTFGAFGGHEATAFGESTPPDSGHTGGPCCADHLEEMLFPSTTWGKTFAIARSEPRTNESDVLRVLAQKPGTTVTFTPAPVSGTCGTLGPGEFCEVKIAGDTEITTTEPVLVGHFLQSSIWSDTQGANTGAIGNGDPSMAIAVPIEQYRKDYTVLVPAQYDESYLSISAAPTGGVSVDGVQINVATFAGGGTARVARIPVGAGQH